MVEASVGQACSVEVAVERPAHRRPLKRLSVRLREDLTGIVPAWPEPFAFLDLASVVLA